MRLLIDETRVSQQDIADYVGVSRQAVSQWKDGKTIPDMYNFKKIAEFFKVPMEYLYGETDSKIKEYLALADSIGLSDKAISKLQAWASEKESGLISLATKTELLSDIITDADFDGFIHRIQQYIVEYIEHRLHQEDESNKEFYANEKAISWTSQDADNNARIVGMRAIKAEDLSTYYKYQAIEALERVLYAMPEEYYIAYKLEQEGKDGKHSAEKE
jgi:transcriptional regulator with XRE-family HTH domain